MTYVFVALVLLSYVAVPAGIIWGWMIFFANRALTTPFAIASFAGFALATASALLVVGSAAYANLAGGFEHFDPRLMPILRWGLLLSVSAILVSLVGVWKKNLLRWHGVGCSVGMTLVWLYFIVAE